MSRRFRNLRIGTKITIIVSLLMVVTLTTVGMISFNSASDALFTSYETSLTTQASQTAQILGDGIQFTKVAMNDTAVALSYALDDDADLEAVLAEKQNELGYMYMRYTGKNGTVVSVDGNEADLSGEESFQQALSGEIVLSRPVVFEADGQLYFYAFAPVTDAKGSVKGVLTALVPYNVLYQLISTITIGETGYGVMLDEVGTVAMHPATDKVINQENTLELAKNNPALRALEEIVQKCVNRETGFGQYTYTDGTVKYMSYAPIPDSNWTVLLAVPKAELFTQIDHQLVLVILSSVISLAVIMAVLLLFVRTQISKPLKKTADFAIALSSGNLDAKNTVDSKDEVGKLSFTLDHEVRDAFLTIEKNRVVSEKQARYQGEHVDKLVVNLERLSSGDLHCDMLVANPDEDTNGLYELFTKISDNLHLTVNTLKTYIGEISNALSAMSSGNLNVSIQSDYRGDFVALKDSINSIAGSLSQVMSEINIAAEQVAAGTSQVSDGSQAISQGATEQAGAIEELSSTVTQIAEQTKQNALNANRANELTFAAKNDAVKGNDQMKAMQNAMAQINEASENISKIIKVIDDIAFQTNILALNAAVEAARAGVHGKGFAVVAEEVRNLAARSANAAKETTALIEGSIKKTEAGTKIANETADALENIVNGVEKAAQLVSEITAASGDQAGAIAQVNQGIEQLSQVVQTNSATSEETAASAEELSSQAEMLKSMVGHFTLQETGEQVRKVQQAPSTQSERPAAAPARRIILNDADFGKY